jgi:hypothetical protein
VHHLDRAEVLAAVVAQLRKDLSLAPEDLPQPPLGEEAFEALRAPVLEALHHWQRNHPIAFSRAINRIDLTERQVNAALERGGLHELAGTMVLRALQKVLSRLRYAGRF